jgi:hypothetical protein
VVTINLFPTQYLHIISVAAAPTVHSRHSVFYVAVIFLVESTNTQTPSSKKYSEEHFTQTVVDFAWRHPIKPVASTQEKSVLAE